MKNTNLTRAAASLQFQRILQRSNRRERSFQRSCQ